MKTRVSYFDVQIPFEQLVVDRHGWPQNVPLSDEALQRLQRCTSVSVRLEINQHGEIVGSNAWVNTEGTSRNHEACYDPNCSHHWARHYSVDESMSECKFPGCPCKRFVSRNEYEIGEQPNAIAIRPVVALVKAA
jgi:hypothetical protein